MISQLATQPVTNVPMIASARSVSAARCFASWWWHHAQLRVLFNVLCKHPAH